MPAYDALFSHIFVKHNVQIGNVKLIDETTGRISNSLVSVADVNNASLNALADGKLSNIEDAISLINLKLGDVETLWQDVYYPNDTQITIMNLTSYIDNLHNEVVTIQRHVVGNEGTNTPGLVKNVENISSIVVGNEGTNTPGLVTSVGLLQTKLTNLEDAVVGNNITNTLGLVWDVQTLQTNFTNLESTVVGNDTTTKPGLVRDVELLQGNVTNLEAAVDNIQMDVDLAPLVSNIDINREQLGNLKDVVLPGLVGNVTALQTSVADMRGGNVDSSINLSMLYTKILDLQAQVDVLKDPFSVQVVSSTTTEIKMRLQGRSSGDITVNIGGQNFNIQNYDGNSELLVTDLQPNTIYDVTVTFANPSFFTYYIQMSTK